VGPAAVGTIAMRQLVTCAVQIPYPGDGEKQFGLAWWVLMFEVRLSRIVCSAKLTLAVIPLALCRLTSLHLTPPHPSAILTVYLSPPATPAIQVFIFIMIMVLLVMPRHLLRLKHAAMAFLVYVFVRAPLAPCAATDLSRLQLPELQRGCTPKSCSHNQAARSLYVSRHILLCMAAAISGG
jgi:hypothetical protein